MKDDAFNLYTLLFPGRSEFQKRIPPASPKIGILKDRNSNRELLKNDSSKRKEARGVYHFILVLPPFPEESNLELMMCQKRLHEDRNSKREFLRHAQVVGFMGGKPTPQRLRHFLEAMEAIPLSGIAPTACPACLKPLKEFLLLYELGT